MAKLEYGIDPIVSIKDDTDQRMSLFYPSHLPHPKNKLSRKVKKSKFIKPLKIPSNDKPVKPNTKCQVAGWGKTENQNTVSDLLVADVSIISLKDCQAEWSAVKTTLPDSVLCAGGYGTKRGACQVRNLIFNLIFPE